MNTTDTNPLSALRDIHLPDPVSWWPLAIGWWVLIGFAVLVILRVAFMDRQRRKLRAFALAEVDRLAGDCRKGSNSSHLATGLSVLLRRVALVRFPDDQVAALHGNAWIDFLSRTSERPETMVAVADGLEHSLYAPPEPVEHAQGDSWIEASRSWIRRNT